MDTNHNARFKKFRSDRGWSQKRMAAEFGVSQPTVARWEGNTPPSDLALKLLGQYEASGYGLDEVVNAEVAE